MKAIRLISAAAAAACLTFTACSDYVGKEDSHPLYAKYESAKSKKAYEEAADNLEEFLTICPKSPKAHYDVAMVYKENLRKYPFAIYHLQKYLDLSGETISKEDIAAIQGYMQDCKRLMAAEAAAANPQSNSALIAAQTENEALKARIGKLENNASSTTLLERKLSAQKQQYDALTEKYNKLVKEYESVAGSRTQGRQAATSSATRTTASTSTIPSAPRTTTSTATSTIPSAPRTTTSTATSTIPSAPRTTTAATVAKDGVPGSVIEGENGIRYYYLDNGDGWERVSRKMYGTPSMIKFIQEANSGVTSLQAGKLLVIPPAPKQ